MENKWKNKNFFASLNNALNGIKSVLKTEKNIKIQIVFAIIAIISGIIFKISLIEFSIIILTIFIVFISEFINTAIETAVDMFTQEYNEKAKIAKDISSGAVTLSAICSIIIGFMIFLPKVLKILVK